MRYEAVFDCGDEETLAAWEVVEWTVVNEKGRIGRTVERFYGKDAEEYANEVADYYNDMLANPFDVGCEFDGKIA